MQRHWERVGVISRAVKILQRHLGILREAGLAIVVKDPHIVQTFGIILCRRTLKPPPRKELKIKSKIKSEGEGDSD